MRSTYKGLKMEDLKHLFNLSLAIGLSVLLGNALILVLRHYGV